MLLKWLSEILGCISFFRIHGPGPSKSPLWAGAFSLSALALCDPGTTWACVLGRCEWEPVGFPRKGRNPSCLFIKFRSWDFSRIHAFLRWVHILSCWREQWENLQSINLSQVCGPLGEKIRWYHISVWLSPAWLGFSCFDTRPETLWLATLFSLLNRAT